MKAYLFFLFSLVWFSWTSCAAQTVRIVHFLSETSGPLNGLKAVALAYSERIQDEEIVFEFQGISMEEYAKGLYGLLVSSNGPDMVQCFSAHAKEHGARLGQAVRLTAYLEGENKYSPGTTWKDLFEPSLLQDGEDVVYGDLWSLPFASATERIFVNMDLLQKCGLSVPKDWSSMLRCHEVLEEKGYIPCVMTGVPGARPPEWVLNNLQSMLWQNRVEGWDNRNRDGRVDRFELTVAILEGEFSLNDPEFLEPLRLLNGWAQYWQDNFQEEIPQTGLEKFIQGDVGFYLDTMTRYREIKRGVNDSFRIRVMPVPKVSRESSSFADGGYYEPSRGPGLFLTVPVSVERQRDRLIRTMDFLQFLTSKEGQEIMVREGHLLPATLGIQLDPELDGFRRRIVGQHPIPNPFILFSEARKNWVEEGFRDDLLTNAWDPAKVREKMSPLLLEGARELLAAEIQFLQRQQAYHRGAYALLEIKSRAARSNKDETVAKLIEDTKRRSWRHLEFKHDLLIYLRQANDRFSKEEK